MMGFMEDLGENVTEFAKGVGDKARELTDIARLHAGIKAEELKIQEQYHKLGKKYYALYKDTPDFELIDMVDAISKSNNKINSYREELQKESGKSNAGNSNKA